MARSASGKELQRALPPWYPKDDQAGLADIMDGIGNRIDEMQADIEAVDRASTVQHADTLAQLRQHGKLVSLLPREGESKESYRSRLIAAFQLNTCEGTAEDIITIASEILNISVRRVVYEKSTEAGAVTVSLPATAVSNLNLTTGDVATIVDSLAAAGYRVDAVASGTLEYVTETEHANTTDWTGYPGYDGLDANGNPTGTGGTYSGLL